MRAVLFFLTTLLLVGCRSIQYVPVETVRTEYKTNTVHDSVIIENTVHDSVMVIYRDDTVHIERWHVQWRDRWRERIITDTLVRQDSIQVPYPVEKRLTKWQQLKQDWGGWLLLADVCVISYFLYYYIYRKRRR